MISALAWLPKGAARRNPIKADGVNETELPPEMPESVQEGAKAEGDDLIEKLLEHYDSEDEGEVPASLQNLGKDLLYYDDPTDDPYLQAKPDDGSDSDAEEMTILPTDGVLVAARKGEDDFSTIQVYVYEEEEGNVYEHHDITLPAFPLCLEWIGLPLRNTEDRNFVAVGTFEPAIEIWDMDTLDVMEPLTSLGGILVTEDPRDSKKTNSKKKKKKNTKPVERFVEGSHSSAVLSLSWNRCHEVLLASGSADTTVKVWDLTTAACAHTFSPHTKEVQAVQWHPTEASLLLTGSMDGTVTLIDARQPDAAGKWTLPSEVECIAWKAMETGVFSVGTDTGLVLEFDARLGADAAPRFMLDAHTDACTVVSHNPTVEGLFLTASHDKTVKLWDSKSGQPQLLAQNNLEVGAVFSASFWADSPFIVAVGGETGKLKLWDIRESSAVQKKYHKAREGISAVPIATTLDEIDSDQDMAAEEEEEDSDNSREEEEI